MPVQINTPGFHHVAIRVSDFGRSKQFYTETLGFTPVLEAENIFLFMVGNQAVAVRGPESETPKDDTFSPFRVGMDHVALACTDEKELERVATALKEAGIWTTGVKMDEVLGKNYVAFKDPDQIKWEYYMV